MPWSTQPTGSTDAMVAHTPIPKETERVALEEIRAVYTRTLSTLRETSNQTTTLRARLISEANPHLKKVSVPLCRALLTEVSVRSGHSGGFSIPQDALNRACIKLSLGPAGVVPEKYGHLVSHAVAMCRALDQLIRSR